MGITDVEGNTGRHVNKQLSIVPTDVPPWLLDEHNGMGHGVTWQDAEPALLGAALQAVTGAGAAFSCSAARDYRSVSITILDGPAKPKFYASTPGELNSLLRRLSGAR